MSETDPWAQVDHQMEILAAWSRRPPATFDELAQPIIGLVVAVNAARAAEAAQHQQEIAAKDETILQQAEDIAYFKDFRDSVAAALCVENEQGPVDPSAIVEAADSTLSQLFDFSARLATVEAERDNQYTQAVEATQRALLAEQALASTEAERDRLKAALERLRDCDWTIGRGDRMDAVRDIARAALIPQGQSTDGETR